MSRAMSPPSQTECTGLPVVDAVIARLQCLPATHQAAIGAAADLFATCARREGVVHVFGAGHSHLLVEELFFRAGGLLIFNALLDPALMLHESALAASAVERLPGYARIVLDKYRLDPVDALLVISYSGVNPVPVEVAVEGKRRGLPVVALTGVAASRAAPARHASGRRLCDVADLVLDNPGVPGDAALAVPSLEERVCALSTILGATILQSVVYETARCLQAEGVRPPVVISANVRGGDEANAALIARYRARLRHL